MFVPDSICVPPVATWPDVLRMACCQRPPDARNLTNTHAASQFVTMSESPFSVHELCQELSQLKSKRTSATPLAALSTMTLVTVRLLARPQPARRLARKTAKDFMPPL